jgi:hypothetical protein
MDNDSSADVSIAPNNIYDTANTDFKSMMAQLEADIDRLRRELLVLHDERKRASEIIAEIDQYDARYETAKSEAKKAKDNRDIAKSSLRALIAGDAQTTVEFHKADDGTHKPGPTVIEGDSIAAVFADPPLALADRMAARLKEYELTSAGHREGIARALADDLKVTEAEVIDAANIDDRFDIVLISFNGEPCGAVRLLL